MNTAGSSDKLEVDLNFMLRVRLWPVATLDSQPLGPAVAREIAIVDRHELAAGKLAGLVARNASRDIFDARELLRRTDLDRDKLRLACVVYGGLNRKDWRTGRSHRSTGATVAERRVPPTRAARAIGKAPWSWRDESRRALPRKGGTAERSEARRGQDRSEAYKDVEDVVDVIAGAGISHKVAKLVPLGVIKG